MLHPENYKIIVLLPLHSLRNSITKYTASLKVSLSDHFSSGEFFFFSFWKVFTPKELITYPTLKVSIDA